MKFSLFHLKRHRTERPPRARHQSARKQRKVRAMTNPRVGTPEFDRYVFLLSEGLNSQNVKTLMYKHHVLVSDGFNNYIMPAYSSPTLSLYLIATVISGWSRLPILSFSRGYKSTSGRINIDPPMTTGEGLNRIGREDPNSANDLLQYFRTLQVTHYGRFICSSVK